MVRETTGDLLTFNANLICHQVNYYGVMGGGIAASIREKMLSEAQYAKYVMHCANNGKNALGGTLYLPTHDSNTVIANLFSQDDFTTDYTALRCCLKNVEKVARVMGWTVALPGNMGCGIAAGDWGTVYKIIQEIFAESSVELTIVYWYADRPGKLQTN